MCLIESSLYAYKLLCASTQKISLMENLTCNSPAMLAPPSDAALHLLPCSQGSPQLGPQPICRNRAKSDEVAKSPIPVLQEEEHTLKAVLLNLATKVDSDFEV